MTSVPRVGLIVAVTLMLSGPWPVLGYADATREAFTARGRSDHWQIGALFTPAEWGAEGTQETPEVGYEFSPEVTYDGPEQRIYWYRIEPLFPRQITLRARPSPPMKRGSCVVDVEFTSPQGEGAILPPGKTYAHGRCDVYPWAGGGTDLANLVSKGLYLVAWEDNTGVHAESVPLNHIKFQR